MIQFWRKTEADRMGYGAEAKGDAAGPAASADGESK